MPHRISAKALLKLMAQKGFCWGGTHIAGKDCCRFSCGQNFLVYNMETCEVVSVSYEWKELLDAIVAENVLPVK